MNLAENTTIPGELGLLWALEYLDTVSKHAVSRFSSMKYIDRIEFELANPMKASGFNNFCDIMTNHSEFMVENVRWSRFDRYLAVVAATFVRWKPSES